MDLSELDGIAVTAGPGLVGALVVGLSAAKALASWLNKPLYGVNHLAGHVAVDLLEHGELPMPCGALLVSGGHTSLLRVNDIATDIIEVGSTIDDAAGEAPHVEHSHSSFRRQGRCCKRSFTRPTCRLS